MDNFVVQGVSYDNFQVQNTKWLWFGNDIVTTLNSDKVLWLILFVPELHGRRKFISTCCEVKG